MAPRLGDILERRGILDARQVAEAVRAQADTGEPFGAICERLFQVDPDLIEDAWAEQYCSITRTVDPRHEVFEDRALDLVSRRQAWQFGFLPIRFDGEELMVATTRGHVRRALRFATRFIGVPVYLVMADELALGEALCRRYPLAGMTPQSLREGSMNAFIARTRGASPCAEITSSDHAPSDTP